MKRKECHRRDKAFDDLQLQFARKIALVALIVTPAGILLSLLPLIERGLWSVVAADIVTAAWIVATPILFEKRPALLGPAIIIPIGVLSIIFYVAMGPSGPRPLWIATTITLAAVFLELRGVWITGILLTVVLALLYSGFFPTLTAWHTAKGQAWPVRLQELGISMLLSLGIGVLVSMFASELRKQLAEIRHSQQRYQIVADNAGDMIWTMDLNLKFTYVSPASQRILGYSPEEMLAQPLETTTHPESLKRIHRLLTDRMERYKNGEPGYAEPAIFDVHVIRRDGTVLPTMVHARLVTDEQGRPQSIVGITRDASQQWQFEQLMRIQRDLAIAAADKKNLPDLLATCLDAALSSAGMEMGALYLLDEKTGMLQETVTKGLPDTIAEPMTCIASWSNADGQSQSREAVILTEEDWVRLFPELSPEHRVETTVLVPIESDAKTVGYVLAGSNGRQDFPQYQKRALETIASQIGTHLARFSSARRLEASEESRRRLEEELFQTQKMEAIGRLAGGVAHDFNNVLCAISGLTDIMLPQLPESAPLRKHVEEISEAAGRAADLTAQLLAFSRKQVIRPERICLNERVRGIESMLKRLLGEDIAFETQLAERLPPVLVDPSQMDQVIMNLAINARDAMPNGGRLTVATEERLLDERYCANHVGLQPGRHVVLTISDTGLGISPEAMEKIFEPFFTTKGLGQGTGLGLATVLGIVEQNGGRILVDSTLGKGTTFSVIFPAVDAQAAPLPASGEITRPTARTRGGERILLVEDDPLVRKVVVELLHRLGYDVLVADSGQKALEIAQKEDGSIDLLFTDVVMPDMNGRELAETVESLYPDVAVLFTSGYSRKLIAPRGILSDDVEFISKPYRLAELSQRVRAVLDRAAFRKQAQDNTSRGDKE